MPLLRCSQRLYVWRLFSSLFEMFCLLPNMSLRSWIPPPLRLAFQAPCHVRTFESCLLTWAALTKGQSSVEVVHKCSSSQTIHSLASMKPSCSSVSQFSSYHLQSYRSSSPHRLATAILQNAPLSLRAIVIGYRLARSRDIFQSLSLLFLYKQ